ncbi:MAG TPA: inositol 2-dehydrogenase [Terriglobales bacterium]|nr:inositol 2-dehydrogenase [Terriglobales bacterium]
MRVGVCGVGRIGCLHAENLACNAERAELVSVADPIKALARKIADRFGARMYASSREMIKKERLDAVVVATPTPTHAKLVELAVDAHLPVFLEKPIALTLKEADKIASLVNRSGIKFQLGFNRRWDPSYSKAEKEIAEGKIGRTLVVKTCARDPQPPPDAYIKHSGGIFVDECIHDFDMALWLMKDHVRQVWAMGTTLVYPQFSKYGDYDNAVAILRFSNRGLGIVEGSRTSTYGYDLRTEILGDRGQIQVENWKEHATRRWDKSGITEDQYPWFLTRFAEAYKREITGFCEYVARGDRSPVSADEGREALRLALAARESARKGSAVELSR